MTTRKLFNAALAAFALLPSAAAFAAPDDQTPAPDVAYQNSATLIQAHALLNDTNAIITTSPDSVSITQTLRAPAYPLNAAAAAFVDAYIKKNEEGLEAVEARSASVFRIMEPILTKYEIPVELKYLAVVESDLKRTAVSRVGAAGPWQLMPRTARELGLRVGKSVDERKQYQKSTIAAAKYLRDLYNYYGDWLLVIAAYNAGPGIINKAIKRTGSKNFWKLQYALPAETRGHVKRYIGTHYYFEERGSATTLTKAENERFAKVVEAFMAKQEATAATAQLMPVTDANLTVNILEDVATLPAPVMR